MNRPKQPILLSSIIQYYLEDEHALKRSKKILIQQMKDIITLTQFLENKIPTMMKTIKQTIRDQNKSMRNFNDSFKRNVEMITGNPKYQSQCYLEAAFDQMNHFTSNKEADKDYHERTLAEKQFKLKFLQSENLPLDFVWIKSNQIVRPSYNHNNQRENKDQLYYSSFNSKLNLIQVVTRKYRILIGLQVQNNKYVWCINRIQLKLNRQVNLMLQTYFQVNVKPSLKQKSPLRYEENMLACIQRFSFYLELIDINRHICQLTSTQFFANNIKYQHNGKIYLMNFTRAEDLRDALITISQQEESIEPNFFLVLQFKKEKIIGRFHIKDYLILQSSKQFTYQNPTTLFSHFQTLLQCSKKYIKTITYLNRNIHDINKHVFIRLNGVFWITRENGWMRKQHYYVLNEDGMYAGNDHDGYFAYVTFTQRYLTSSKVSTPFLNKLAKIVTKFEIIFFIIQIIQTVLVNNKQKQCQYDCCSITNDKINLFFRKKICAQDTIIRNEQRQRNNQEEMTFNFLKFLTEFTSDFGQMLFYSFREVDQKSQEHKDEWKSLFYPECNPQRNYISINRAIKAILYMQDNVIFKYVHEKKLRSESRSHFHIRF